MKHSNKNCILVLAICCLSMIYTIPAPRAAGLQSLSPADVTQNPARFWAGVMEEFYGPYDKSLKCWVGEVMTEEGEERLCMRPHKLTSVDVRNTQQHHVAIGGYALNDQNGRDDCHACSGRVGFVVLENGPSSINIITKNSLAEAMGSWGSVPPEENFELRNIGKDNAYGWIVHSGYSGQGYTYLGAGIYGMVGDMISQLGFVPTGFSDEGNCDGGKNIFNGNPCSDYSAEIEFIEVSDTSFYTARLKHSGTYQGEPMDEVVDIAFDEATSTYKVPESLSKN